MTEARVVLTAEDNASRVIDHVTKRLGIFNKEGIAMGVSFALVNKAIQLAEQGFRMLTDAIMDGIHSSMDLEYNLVQLSNTTKNFDVSIKTLKDDLSKLSSTYGVDINVLASNMRMFTREGYSVSASVRMVGEAEKYAKANGEDLTSVIDAMNSAMEVFDMDADDSAYILKEFNAITTKTNMSIQQISDIFGRAAPNIRESGYSLKEIIDIIYTLEQQGDKPRAMLAEINDVLKNIGERKIEILSEDDVTNIDEKFKKVEKTATFYWDKIAQDAGAIWRAFGEDLGAIGNWFTTPLNAGSIPQKPQEPPAIVPQADWMDEYIRKQEALTAAITLNKQNIADYTLELAKLNQEQSRDKTQYYFTIAMHDATLAVKEQEDAIERLRRISNAYGLEQQRNNLEIMKIQYAAGPRGVRRSQQRQIDIIERENMLLRIKEGEQQIAISTIQQTGLQTAQDALDAIRRTHDQVIYQQELEDLSKHIDDVHTLWLSMYEQLAKEKAALLNNYNSISGGATSSGSAGGIPNWKWETASSQVARDTSRRRGVFDLR